MSDSQKELSLLTSVTIICFLFGLAGTILSFFASSSSLRFDGLYSLIQSFFILLSGRVSRLIRRDADDEYQFGYSAFEPFFIIVRTTVLLCLNVSMAYGAVKSLLSGGSPCSEGVIIWYAVISFVVCVVVSVLLVRTGKRLSSPLLKTEAVSWLNDSLISLAVLVSFAISTFLPENISLYIDGAVTLLFTICLTPGLVRIVIRNARELLCCAPDEKVQEEIESMVKKVLEPLAFTLFDFSAAKQGRSLSVTIVVTVDQDYTVSVIDAYRGKLVREIRRRWPLSDIEVLFSSSLRLA